MRISYNNHYNQLTMAYISRLYQDINRQNILSPLSPKAKQLTKHLLLSIDLDSDEEDHFTSLLLDYVAEHSITDIAHLFDGELRQMLDYLLGAEWAELYVRYIRLKSKCPYTSSWRRRSVRSSDPLLHIGIAYSDGIKQSLEAMLELRATGFTTIEILRGGRTTEEIKEIRNNLNTAAWIAAMIDAGDQEVISYLHDAMTSENNANRVNHEHFRAISISGHRELLELEGKLLLAARLQEGLRQAIVETMDEGQPESFVYLLGVIRDHGLQRYAAIQRGIAVATGLGSEADPKRITDKYIELVYTYTTDTDSARRAIQESDDAIEVYLGLWALAFYRIEDIAEPIKELITSAPSHKVRAAMLTLSFSTENKWCEELAALALRTRADDLSIVSGALPYFLDEYKGGKRQFQFFKRYYDKNDKIEIPIEIPQISYYFADREEAKAYFELMKQIYDRMGGRDHDYEHIVIDNTRETLKRGSVARKICLIALLLRDEEYVMQAIGYVTALDTYERASMIMAMLHDAKSREQIQLAISFLSDRSEDTRDEAGVIVQRLHRAGKLLPEDYLQLEELLRLKASKMRICVMEILSTRPQAEAEESVRRLIADKSAERRLSALEMIKGWSSDAKRMERMMPLLETIKRPTSREVVIIDTLHDIHREGDTYSRANGYGLYDPNGEPALGHLRQRGEELLSRLTDLTLWEGKENRATSGIIGKVKDALMQKHQPKEPRAITLMKALLKIIEEHADHQFTNVHGSKQRLGNSVVVSHYTDAAGSDPIDQLVLPELWREYYTDQIGTPEELLKLYYAVMSNSTNETTIDFGPVYKKLLGAKLPKAPDLSDLTKEPHYQIATTIVQKLASTYMYSEAIIELSIDLINEATRQLTAEEMIIQEKSKWWGYDVYHLFDTHPLVMLFDTLKKHLADLPDEEFGRAFAAIYHLSNMMTEYRAYLPSAEAMARAYDIGLLTDEDMMQVLMSYRVEDKYARPNEYLGTYTDWLTPEDRRPKYLREQKGTLSRMLRSTLLRVVDRVLEIELARGDAPTEVTALAATIQVVPGIQRLVRILNSMGNMKPLVNTYFYNATSKKEICSSLLRNSRPEAEETVQDLLAAAHEHKISHERLAEIAIYARAWLPLVEETIGWKGLSSAAYYFLAHTGEGLSEQDKSTLSRYTAVPAEDFEQGGFDPTWFREIYETLGKERFEIIYDSSKYLCSSNKHTRARKFSDAALGLLKPKEVMSEIEEKRNKDLVAALGIIPLRGNKAKEIRTRYDLMRRFLKESKAFGAQRQASEARAVKLGLDNLARTAGYSDTDRLTWSMEAALIREVTDCLQPQEVADTIAYIELTDESPKIVVESKGKRLQSIPSRLKKEKHMERLRTVLTQLKEQHTRGRALLEQSMVQSSTFETQELSDLSQNPIIWGLISRLVLMTTDGAHFGFPAEDGSVIQSVEGTAYTLQADDQIRIAHPHDLYSHGVWSAYQSYLFEHRVRQPFKQVFRELYLATTEEAEMAESMRYSGNQIMPQRAAALLKKRQWSVDYEYGLQKVDYHANVTAVIYAMADWFSPSDIESPTLEYVSFYRRTSFAPIKIKEIPPIVYSEILRDVDLMVSVAHAGGVDPETSHSTIEMRQVIVAHAMPLFGITNVEVVGNFAKIKGVLASYNVHLGSGVIHREGGAQIAVLPVHTQDRGRLFLPFLDEDPKTAEIISKVVLFAEDTKIKDPMILNQI